jgi:hypothetical protein
MEEGCTEPGHADFEPFFEGRIGPFTVQAEANWRFTSSYTGLWL